MTTKPEAIDSFWAPEETAGFWRRARSGFGYSPAVIILAGVLLALIVPPIVYLFQTSFYTTTFAGEFDKFTFGFYTELVTNPRFFNNFVNTTVYAVGSAIFAIGLGTAQAWIVERTNTPFRQYMFLVAIISLGIPHVLYTIAWLLIMGKAGPVNDILRAITGSQEAVLNVYSMWGMILIEGVGFAPLAFLLLSSVFRSTDASFEEASMMSGAGISQTFRHITARLAMPGIMALMLLIFIRAFESFEVPALVGLAGGINVLTTDIYESIQTEMPPNYGQSGAFSVVLLMWVMVLLYWYNQLSRHAERFQTITGKGYRPRRMDLGKWRYLTAGSLVLLFLLIIGLPVGIVLWASLQPYYEGVTAESLGRFTLDNYVEVAKAGSFRDSIFNTLILGTATATAVVPFTALCAWLAVRRYKGGWFLDQMATLPLIFPAIVMGVAFLQVFLNMPFGLYGTLLSVVIASVVREMPYGMRYSYAGLLQIHTELEEASAVSGAGQVGTFLRIVMPLVAPAMITCWLFLFLIAVRAVSMPILLVGPNSQIVAVTLFDLWENGQVTELAAMGMAWMALMTGVSCLFYIVVRRYRLSLH
ncbi:MAG: iron ABC transporter permease [Proteobacteria bacterium]|nr:iron ABC transporter permease [Pseudomonadota bacterium]